MSRYNNYNVCYNIRTIWGFFFKTQSLPYRTDWWRRFFLCITLTLISVTGMTRGKTTPNITVTILVNTLQSNLEGGKNLFHLCVFRIIHLKYDLNVFSSKDKKKFKPSMFWICRSLSCRYSTVLIINRYVMHTGYRYAHLT